MGKILFISSASVYIKQADRHSPLPLLTENSLADMDKKSNRDFINEHDVVAVHDHDMNRFRVLRNRFDSTGSYSRRQIRLLVLQHGDEEDKAFYLPSLEVWSPLDSILGLWRKLRNLGRRGGSSQQSGDHSRSSPASAPAAPGSRK